jgi:hypothetical protein
MVGLKKLNLPGVDFGIAKLLAKSALNAIQGGQLGYVIIAASRPPRVA